MQMAKWIVAFLLTGLVACGEGYIDNNYGYGYHYDEADIETGLRVRYHPEAQANIPLTDLITIYRDVQACTGLHASGPLVIFTDAPITANGQDGPITRQAFYFYSGTVVANADFFLYITISEVRHEFIHHLLAVNGESSDDNYNHRSSLFKKCESPD